MLNIFDNPFDPERSIQLNRKYWKNSSYKYLNLLEDAEGCLSSGNHLMMSKILKKINHPVLNSQNLIKLFGRVIKLKNEKNDFGLIQGRIEIEERVINQSKYIGLSSRASYPVSFKKGAGITYLCDDVLEKYKKYFGFDFVKINKTIRFASPDGSAHDNAEFGLMSDFHYDERKGITSVVYMSDVDIDSGPFQYIDNSDLIPKSVILSAIGQFVCFDLGIVHPYKMNSLPLEFRATPSIGSFLEDWKIDQMKSNLTTMVGKPGSFVMFNGQNILHRGGKPLLKNRHAIFLQPEGIFFHKIRSMRSLFHGALLKCV